LESIQAEEKTMVFYESPSRIADMLQAVYNVLGDRQIVIARELTKVFEEIKRGRISDILSQVSSGNAKGEFTVILQGAFYEPVSLTDDEIQEKLLRLWTERSISLRDAVADVVRQTGLSRKKVYDMAVKVRPVHD
jgi:16S rRNA (cytidine1402-2'-O)-methyltransferase